MIRPIIIASIALALIFTSCSDDGYKVVESDTPTSGTLKVFCDAGMQKQLGNQAFTFEKIYDRSKINMVYCSESDAIKALFNDSCKTITINRKLSAKEEDQFKAKNIFINQSIIGKSAIALIVNKECSDTTIELGLLKKIIAGDTGKQYFKNIVFESNKSGILNYFTDTLLLGKSLGANCSAASDLTDMLKKIEADKNAIGVLDYIWISDQDDSLYKLVTSKYRILPVAAEGSNTAYYPDQSNIQTTAYPLTRWMYMMRRGEDFSLAAGFITYVAGPSGQVIMLKSGLAPWRQPERLIEVDLKPIDAE